MKITKFAEKLRHILMFIMVLEKTDADITFINNGIL